MERDADGAVAETRKSDLHPMNLEELLTVLRQRWIGMSLIFVTVVLTTIAWTETRTERYTAAASAVMSPQNTTSIGESYSGSVLAQQMAKSYVLLLTSRSVAEEVIDELGLSTAPEVLVKNLTATLPTGTVTITVRATSVIPQRAADIANAVIRVSARQVAAAQGNAPGTPAFVRLVSVEEATAPSQPSSPVRSTAYGGGLAAAAVLALLWGLVRHRTDTRLRTLGDIEEVAAAHAIGVVPQAKSLAEGNRMLAGRDSRMAAEAFRQMRTNLKYVDVDHQPRSIVVTSSVAGEGKSTVAATLARTIASAGTPVVLIDADLRRPSVHTLFGVDDAVGLTQALAGTVELGDAIQDSGQDGLRVIAAGRIPHNPSELLGSQRMRSLIAELSADTFVIVDTPPLLPVTDAALLTVATDGALLVCRSGTSRRAQVVQAVRNLAGVDGRLLGLVVNAAPVGRRAGSDGYGYYAGGEYEPKPGRRRG